MHNKKLIPWQSSTCSKKPIYTPEEPESISHGKGCRIWDHLGREFIDFRCALGPITLGYQFEKTDQAIREQLESGISFGHPHHLEFEVAELLNEMIPCAERVRFLKTGGEAVAATIRLARHVTGRKRILHIGYNGWLNALSPTGKLIPGKNSQSTPLGILEELSQFHHSCLWNDRDDITSVLEQFKGEFAAILIAADYNEIDKGDSFYPWLRKVCDDNNILLIFDEIVTGFRIAQAGVQEYFNTTPDLAVFSKGIANGMPLSAYVGKKEYMDELDKVIISSTFGGETLTLACAKATILTYLSSNVIEHLWNHGDYIWNELNRIFKSKNVPIELKGFSPCISFNFYGDNPTQLQQNFFRKAYQEGVSLYNVSYINFSHRQSDLDEAITRLNKAVDQL